MMKINESLAWSIMEATEFESMTSIKLMSEFQKKYEKREVFFTSAGKAQKMDITEPQKKDSKYKDYAELTRMVRGMTLLIKEKETRNADKSYLLCFNCDGRGHKTRECSRPRNEELYKKLSSEYFNSRKEKSEANKTLMLTEFEDGEKDKTLAAENKRMRLDQINNDYELAEHSFTGSVQNKTMGNLQTKKKKSDKKKNKTSSSTIPVRILDISAPLTNREFFYSIPQCNG
ncbi:hypothetical protein AYI69_g8111 [Smittium culicis]|uniref:CCHC-type domain-containing protein n=1 Tax=Smittium culicis TaxID=133412 RepID=A0A1R1XM41_9FUNG|nr:hypothetical protein AYI69_g8111 [Smittium culicis]